MCVWFFPTGAGGVWEPGPVRLLSHWWWRERVVVGGGGNVTSLQQTQLSVEGWKWDRDNYTALLQMLQSERNKPGNSQFGTKGMEARCYLLDLIPSQHIIKTTITTNHQFRKTWAFSCVLKEQRPDCPCSVASVSTAHLSWAGRNRETWVFCRNVSFVVLAERTEFITPPNAQYTQCSFWSSSEGRVKKKIQRNCSCSLRPYFFPETSLDEKIK